MQALVLDLPWRSVGHSIDDILVFVDDGFSEMFKGSGLTTQFSGKIQVHPLKVNSCTDMFPARSHVVIFTTALDVVAAQTIRELTNCCKAQECQVLTCIPRAVATDMWSSPSKRSSSGSGERDGYSIFTSFLSPTLVSVVHFPLHTVELITGTNQQTIPMLRILSSPVCREYLPVTLGRLQSMRMNRDYSSMVDVNAADLPTSVKSTLKAITHDLAGALVFECGVDVLGSVFALGKTASILGHNLLGVVEELIEERKGGMRGAELRASLLGGTEEQTLQPASLILVDRFQDLLAPASAGAGEKGAPLAHRVQNTLRYCQYNSTKTLTGGVDARREPALALSCDVPLESPLLKEVAVEDALLALGAADNAPAANMESAGASRMSSAVDECQWNRPMSALSGLPLQLNPSLLLSEHLDVQHAVMAGSEEEGKLALCRALKSAITESGGAVPPAKKRGLGAEVLAHVQALTHCPITCHAPQPEQKSSLDDDPVLAAAANYRSDLQGGLGYNSDVCSRYEGLLSLSLAVVESMQRSNGKQFQQLCDWQCSYEARAAREADVDAAAQKFQDFDICIARIMSYFLTPAAAPKGAEKEKEKEASATAGPVDIVHILVLIVRLVSQFRQMVPAGGVVGGELSGSSNFSALEECISEFILHKSCVAELVYLEGLRFLPIGAARDVQIYRTASAEADALLCAQLDAAAPVEGDKDELADKELLVEQLQSSIRDQVRTSLDRVLELQREYAAQRGALVVEQKVDVAAADQVLNLLSAPELGLIGKIVEGFLTKRLSLLRARNVFSSAPDSAAGDGTADGMLSALEFVESPLEKMKRTGLGLLSKGLGSLGFGFGSQVAAAVSTPHPAERPVLVLFVLGGVSYKEVGQVQQLLRCKAVRDARIIILSTTTIGAEAVLFQIFS